jgi:ADP-dependent NAD(P)H-hydrate dehydratase / NAD(P)H-hydrate epimerase
VKPVLTPQEAFDLDRATQASGIPADVLMERAGRAVARAAVDRCGGVYGRRAVVVCGKGNNGGDGYVAARHLARAGMRVSVVAVEVVDHLREPASTNARRLMETGIEARPYRAGSLSRDLARADVVVDAVFGTGFRGVPEDEWGSAIEVLNGSVAPVVAVDIPSGVNGLTGAVDGDAVRADITVTFGAAKVGAVLMPGAACAGVIRVVDIGFPDGLMQPDAFLVEPGDVADALPVRPVDTHKRASGVLVVVAGSREMTGAPTLIARAAARIGAGLVMVGVPRSVLPVVQGASTESVFIALPETAQGTVSLGALEPVLASLGRAHALAIGPGLTQDEGTAGLVRELVRSSPVPVVLDADGLNAFTARAVEIADRKADAVITPHDGEFSRLTGLRAGELAEDRLRTARALAVETRAVTVMKGPRTIVTAPDAPARINTTGGPVLATAGSGDVLTGVIGGLLARGLDPTKAAWAGAYLHGAAGQLAGRIDGEGTLASDVADHLPAAIERVRADG